MEIEEISQEENKLTSQDQLKIMDFLNSFQPKIQFPKNSSQHESTSNKIEIQQKNEEFNKGYGHLLKQFPYLQFNEVLNTPVNKEVAVIGTFYKIMKQRQSILDSKVATTNVSISTNFSKNYCSEDDKLYIEDKTGRMEIDLSEATWEYSENKFQKLNKHKLMNGIIFGIIGTYTKKKAFYVKQIIFPGITQTDQDELSNQQIQILKTVRSKFTESGGRIVNSQEIQQYLQQPHKDDKFVAVVSGLQINAKELNPNLKLFQQFILGNYDDVFQNIYSKISKLIIAGNSIENIILDSHDQVLKHKEYQEIRENLNNSLTYLDQYIYDIVNKVSVDIMPGESEPCQKLWPQQHLNKCLFKKSYSLQQFNSISNPYYGTYNNVSILGTSGLNIKEMQAYTQDYENEIDLLELNLHCNVIAPTAPDTLKCYPFTSSDPFILEELPHVYFTGNASKFQTKLISNDNNTKFCRIITCPNFYQTGTFVLINLRNLDALEISFDISKN